ncbi:MAG: hypothetical protein GX614_02115 [Sandaracinaceae bacterium]|nr:hypothetical protein [Sandaracinaceae bacterium]
MVRRVSFLLLVIVGLLLCGSSIGLERTLGLSLDIPQPATRAAERILRRLDAIEERLVATRYQHRTYVDERRGIYYFDCSGLVGWVLEKEAPLARLHSYAPRPTANDFVEAIKRAPARGTRGGWQRIDRIEDAEAGDLFAWTIPKHFPESDLTGHTGFIVRKPRKLPGLEGVYAVRIADSTTVPHQNDTRPRGGEGGFGRGTILIKAGEARQPIGYGWFGASFPVTVEAPIGIGRVHR